MPLQISSLRRWLAAAFVVVVFLVAGTYFYARHRVQGALKSIPEKMGIEIQQTANGFTISKSEQGRTMFKVQASKAVKLKKGGHTELHDVEITIYGRDSDRFDQIHGSDFEYDPQSGDVAAQGPVQIDLGSNPQGQASPDQSAPQALKDSMHLETSGLVFNQKTGDAFTPEKVEFRIHQDRGSAIGVKYASKSGVLTLDSAVTLVLNGETPATITAASGAIHKDPETVLLDSPRVSAGSQKSQADKATIFLRSDNTIQRILGEGNVQIESKDASNQNSGHAHADRIEIMMAEDGSQLRIAVLTGNVQVENSATKANSDSARGTADRMEVTFTAQNVAERVHAEGNVRLTQHAAPTTNNGNPQEAEFVSPSLDASLSHGNQIQHAESRSGGQITIHTVGHPEAERTLVTANRFDLLFVDGRPSALHGAPAARILSQAPNQPDRLSTSDAVDVAFQSLGGIDLITQTGKVRYSDGERRASSESASYSPSNGVLVLAGSPRVSDGAMTTTAQSIKFNRLTGDAFSDGDVRSTYNDLKAHPDGALLASSSPIHVTAQSMTAHQTAATALYDGNVRLWQDANAIAAPSVEFNRDARSVVAKGSDAQPVSTVFFQTSPDGKVTPVSITSGRLIYNDEEREAEFQDGVKAISEDDLTITCRTLDAFLQPREPASDVPNPRTSGPDSKLGDPDAGKIERIVAHDQVLVTQPGRKATGDQLVYTAADGRFVMTGGNPSIFDAEHGKITGVSLTLYSRDDRVLVKGDPTTPTVSQTRVAR